MCSSSWDIFAPGEQEQLGILLKLKMRCDRSRCPSLLALDAESEQLRLPRLQSFLFNVPCFIMLQLSVLFFATILMCLPFFSFLYFFSVICPRNANQAQCSSLILLHIHTWELPTVITVLSCAAMCSSSRAVGASLSCLLFEGEEKESASVTQGFELATFQLQTCIYRLLLSYLSWSTCHVYKQLLGQ